MAGLKALLHVAITGHVGEKGNLVRERIRIGKGCTVGQYTTVFPGATLGDNCHVGAMSLVPRVPDWTVTRSKVACPCARSRT